MLAYISFSFHFALESTVGNIQLGIGRDKTLVLFELFLLAMRPEASVGSSVIVVLVQEIEQWNHTENHLWAAHANLQAGMEETRRLTSSCLSLTSVENNPKHSAGFKTLIQSQPNAWICPRPGKQSQRESHWKPTPEGQNWRENLSFLGTSKESQWVGILWELASLKLKSHIYHQKLADENSVFTACESEAQTWNESPTLFQACLRPASWMDSALAFRRAPWLPWVEWNMKAHCVTLWR